MRPDRIKIASQPSARELLHQAQREATSAYPGTYDDDLRALLGRSSTRPLTQELLARPILAHALNHGDITLTDNDICLTPQGRMRLRAPTSPPADHRALRQGTSWISDPQHPSHPKPGHPRPHQSAPTRHLTVATDSSKNRKDIGIAAVTDDYRWAMTAYPNTHLQQTSTGLVKEFNNTSELRAIALALVLIHPKQSATILTDSRYVTELIAAWRQGQTTVPEPDRIPPTRPHYKEGLDLFPGKLLLSGLRETILQRPHIQVVHVRGHRGHHLNEAADSLAKIARRSLGSHSPARLPENDEVLTADAATELVTAMVNAHHTQ